MNLKSLAQGKALSVALILIGMLLILSPQILTQAVFGSPENTFTIAYCSPIGTSSAPQGVAVGVATPIQALVQTGTGTVASVVAQIYQEGNLVATVPLSLIESPVPNVGYWGGSHIFTYSGIAMQSILFTATWGDGTTATKTAWVNLTDNAPRGTLTINGNPVQLLLKTNNPNIQVNYTPLTQATAITQVSYLLYDDSDLYTQQLFSAAPYSYSFVLPAEAPYRLYGGVNTAAPYRIGNVIILYNTNILPDENTDLFAFLSPLGYAFLALGAILYVDPMKRLR